MAMARRWVIQCDHDGCTEVRVSSAAERWDAGEEFNDADWQAGPGVGITYCPAHRVDADAWAAVVRAVRGL